MGRLMLCGRCAQLKTMIAIKYWQILIVNPTTVDQQVPPTTVDQQVPLSQIIIKLISNRSIQNSNLRCTEYLGDGDHLHLDECK